MIPFHRKAVVERRVREKKRRRECLVEGCREAMVCRGCCRAHYDAVTALIAAQPTEDERMKAFERLIRDGLLLPKGEQPRRFRATSNSHVFRQSLTRIPPDSALVPSGEPDEVDLPWISQGGGAT